ncbi:MAG: hypothetical protein SVX43_22800, partial [Cyanobacteriota bacterium]|nr:hypothetical protein [Cyanobacteriota bacterium]
MAADRINLYIDDREIAVTITQLEEYSRTGNRSSLPPEIEGIYPYLEPEEQDAFDKFPAQLKKAISIQPNEQLDPDEQDFLNFLVPSKQPQEQQQVLELMAEKGNGQTILDFLKALPVETLTQDNFVSVLTAYTPTKSKAPQPKTPQPKTPTPIDLRTWTQEGLLANGRWVVSPDGSSVLQTINGRPTFFVSPDNFINATINGTFKVQDSDNDFIGFVFGYQSPFTANGNPENDFDFFLFDWKKNLQTEPFAGRSGIGQEGFSLTKVNESIANPIPSFWWHEDSPQFDVLATDYGSSKGWRPYQEYDFTLLYQTDRIKIDI